MKILIITTLYRPHLHGGSEKAATLLAESLAENGHEVVVITLRPGTSETVEDHNGVRIYRLPLDNLYWPFARDHPARPLSKIVWHLRDIWNVRAAHRVARILDREHPEVVHTHSIAGFSASILREVNRRKIRLVHTLHDYYLVCLKSSMFKDGHTCGQRCLTCSLATLPRRFAAGSIDAVVPVSNYVLQQHLAAGCLRDTPAQTLPNINCFIHQQDQTPSPQVHPLTFGYIGRIEPHKGVEVLLKSCTLLGPLPWRLRIAGHASADYLRHLQASYPDPRIEWLGFIDSGVFFSAIDICIVPSLWPEPQPYVVLEALEAGKTLITSDSGGLSEMAALAKTFAVFPSGDHQALALILKHCLLTPAASMDGGFSSQQIRQRFRPQHILKSHLALYNQRVSTQHRKSIREIHALPGEV